MAKAATKQPETQTIEQIALKDLQADPDQPRKHFDEAALKELSADIKSRGIIEPIIYFIADDGKKTILAGERRFRAAKLAKLKTVPCLLRACNNDMERLLDQVSENFQREGLNPIEMAAFFNQLITKHNIKAGQIGDMLQKHGFRKFERSYISNIRRLLQLPEWAQLLIQDKTLTAAHGKYLLTATKSEAVMEQIKEFVSQETPTIDDLVDEIEGEFRRQHFRADYGPPGKPKTVFDTSTCTKCKTSHRIKTNWEGELTYCLNETCYHEKQAAAITAQNEAEAAAQQANKERIEQQAQELGCSVDDIIATEEALSTPMRNNRSDDDDEGVDENEPLSEHYINRQLETHLDNYLQKLINAHLLEDDATRYMVILWIAAGARGNRCWLSVESDENDYDDGLEKHGINIMLKQLLDLKQQELFVCSQAMENMDLENICKLAHHCGIKLDDYYSIDRTYLETKTKQQLIDSTPAAIIEQYEEENWKEFICQLPMTAIQNRILEHARLYGVPEDVAALYAEKLSSTDETE